MSEVSYEFQKDAGANKYKYYKVKNTTSWLAYANAPANVKVELNKLKGQQPDDQNKSGGPTRSVGITPNQAAKPVVVEEPEKKANEEPAGPTNGINGAKPVVKPVVVEEPVKNTNGANGANEKAKKEANEKAKKEANEKAAAKKAAAKEEAANKEALNQVAEAIAKEEAEAAEAVKRVAEAEAAAVSGTSASASAAASGSAGVTSGSTGIPPGRPPVSGTPSGSASAISDGKKLIQVTKNGSNYTAETLLPGPNISNTDINSHKSKINQTTQLVEITKDGSNITGKLIQPAGTTTANLLADAPNAPTGGPPAVTAALATAPKPPSGLKQGGKYKKYTIKRKAKKSKKTRRH
jgi:hypothetical protein